MRDFYDELGVSNTATTVEIKRAFRAIAKACHPDRHPGDEEAERRFKAACVAHEALSDEHKRAAYDHKGHAKVASCWRRYASVDDVADGFYQLFRSLSDPDLADGRGDDVVVIVEAGASAVNVVVQDACEPCRGRGFLKHEDAEACDACSATGRRSRLTTVPVVGGLSGPDEIVCVIGQGGRGHLGGKPGDVWMVVRARS